MPAAFVDVDETLVRDITFLSLFAFAAQRRARGPDIGDAMRASRDPIDQRFWAMRSAGAGRAASHRWFYRAWAGCDVAETHAIGREWFASRIAGPDYANGAVCLHLAELAARGTRIVLVSGSFDAALRPIAAWIGAEAVLCTDLETADGRYTGDVAATMVGEDKAAAVRGYAAETGIDLRRCTALGDHHSDIAMFELVGRPVVVGTADPRLRSYSAERLPG